jgi:hypothetical protein
MIRRGLVFAGRHPAATALTVVGLVLGLAYTADMNTTYDSVRYANVGHWIAQGEGISASLVSTPLQEGTREVADGVFAYTLQPPGLPLFYAATGAAHWRVSHRVLHVVCLGVFALLVWRLGGMLLGGGLPAALVVLVVLFSPATYGVARHCWTDLPFSVLLLGSLWAITCAADADRHWWRWLLLASFLTALAIGFRKAGLVLGVVFLADGIRGALRRGVLHGALRLLAAGAFTVPVIAVQILRNLHLAGSVRGVAAFDPVQPVAPDLLRAWTYTSWRLLEAFVPGFGARTAAERIDAVGADPARGAWMGVLVAVFLLLPGIVLLLRRFARLTWPPRGDSGPRVAGPYAALLVVGSLAVLLLTLFGQDEIRVAEPRFMAPILPLLWIPVAAVLCSGGRRLPRRLVAGVVVAAFAVGVFFVPPPGGRDRESLRVGLDWVAGNLPAETMILSNAGKELVEDDLSRRVRNVSDWYALSMLPVEMRTDHEFRRWAKQRGITHLVLVGRPSERQAVYWGPLLTQLCRGLFWPDHLQYRDNRMRVYRVPLPGERARSSKGGAGR